jgi:uncharacterized membrane protein
MRPITVLIAMLALAALAAAVPVQMISPFQQTINTGDTVFIGTIGPGQTLAVEINPIVTSGGIYGAGGQYDIAQVSNLPPGWNAEQSKLYQNPLQVKITADKAAPPGQYDADITVINENNGEELGNVTFTVDINVTWDVLGMSVSPTQTISGPGQPAQFGITIMNKGSASDTYIVNASGVDQWDFVKQVYVPAESSITVPYEIAGNEEETYNPSISVVSVSSGIIHQEQNVTLIVRSGLLGDYRATSDGTLLFPIFEAPIYALAGLLGAVAKLFGL